MGGQLFWRLDFGDTVGDGVVMTDPGPESPPARRPRGSAVQLVCAVALGAMVAVYCGVLFFSGACAGASVLWDPNGAGMLERWISALADAAQSTVRLALVSVVVMAALAVVAVVAALRGSKIWLRFGIVSGAMLLGTVLAMGFASGSSLSTIVRLTHERIGPVRLVPDTGGAGLEALTNGAKDPAFEAFSSEDADREMRVLVEAAMADFGGLAATVEVTGEKPVEFDAMHPPIKTHSCAPAQPEGLGEQLTLAFTLPSDEEGRSKQRVLAAWAQAGYLEALEDGQRDKSVATKTGASALYAISVDDRFTIDGTLTLQLESRCL